MPRCLVASLPICSVAPSLLPPLPRSLFNSLLLTPNSPLPDGHGGALISGFTNGDFAEQNAGDFDLVIARYNEGGLVWKEQLGSPGFDVGSKIVSDHAGGVYVAGWTEDELFGEHQGNFDGILAHFGDACDPCDANCDGSVDLTDVEAFIKLLFGGDPCAFCTGDANNDGSIDLTDVEAFISCLLG